MNIRVMRLATYLLFGIFIFFRMQDFDKFTKKQNDTDSNSKEVFNYIHKLELKIIIMWFFIMTNIILLAEYIINQ